MVTANSIPFFIFYLALALLFSFLSYGDQAFVSSGWGWTLCSFFLISFGYRAKKIQIPRLHIRPDEKPTPYEFPALIVIATGALFLRLFRLSSLSEWPMWDDGHYSFFALGLMEKWEWKFFFGSEQYMPLYIWIQGLFYRIFSPSLLTLWLYPTIYSIPLPLISYWAIRKHFPGSHSILYACLIGFSFWPLYLSKFSTDIGFCLLWQAIVVGFLGYYRQEMDRPSNRATYWAAIIGLSVGGGWLISKFWFSSIPAFTAIFVFIARPLVRRSHFQAYLGAAFLAFFPLAWLFWKGEYGNHIQKFFILSHNSDFQVHQPWLTSLSYLSSIFWGSLDKSYFQFGPLWGGMLNPLLASAFFLGLLTLVKHGEVFWTYILIVFFYLAQGIFSNSIEMMRVAPLMPALYLVVTMGFLSLWKSFTTNWRWGFLGFCLMISMGLDAYHLFGRFHEASSQMGNPQKSQESFRAFQVLNEYRLIHGPGLIFNDFIPNVHDQTLTTACYQFNSALNLKLDPGDAKWAGIICLSYYGDYLRKKLGDCEIYDLSPDVKYPGVGFVLCLIPLTAFNRPYLLSLVPIHLKIHNLYESIPFHEKNPNFCPYLNGLNSILPKFKNDPLLRAWHLEKTLVALNLGKNYLPAAWLLEQSLQDTSPFNNILNWQYAHIYHLLGLGLLREGENIQAKKSFMRAAHFDPSYPLKKALLLCKTRTPTKNLK